MTTWRDKRKPREPAALAQALERVTSRLGAPSAGTLGIVLSRWPKIVGVEVAEHARPRSLRDGVLTILVDDPAWATQLRYLQSDLLARIAQEAGGSAVEKIEVRVRR